MGVGGQRHTLAALPPGGKTQYPLYRRMGKPQGRSEQVLEISIHRDLIPGTSSP